MAGFDFNSLFEDPTFMMGASLLGNRSPDAMTQAIAAGQAMQRTKMMKQDKESEREMEKARTELYRRQVTTAEENARRTSEATTNFQNLGKPMMDAIMQQMGGGPATGATAQALQGVPNAPQQSQPDQSGSALVPGSLSPGEIEPSATQRALQREQENIASLNRELALPNNPEQRMIKTRELETAQQRLQLLGGAQQKVQAQAIQRSSILPHQMLQALGGYQMGLADPKKQGEGLIEMSKALKPEFGKPGDVNLNTGQALPDAALDYRKTHDADEMARKQQEFRDSERRLQGQANSEDAGRRSLAEERTNLRTEKEGKYYTAHQSLNLSLDQMYDSVKRLKEHKGLDAVTGYRSMVPAALQGQEALNAKGEQEHLEAQVFTNASQAFRRANETGGSVGQQSDWEGKQFVDSWGRLKQAQGTPEYKDALDKLMVNVRAQQLRMKAAYDYYHGKQKGNTAPEQFKRIVATGTKDGKRMIKFEDGSVDSID